MINLFVFFKQCTEYSRFFFKQDMYMNLHISTCMTSGIIKKCTSPLNKNIAYKCPSVLQTTLANPTKINPCCRKFRSSRGNIFVTRIEYLCNYSTALIVRQSALKFSSVLNVRSEHNLMCYGLLPWKAEDKTSAFAFLRRAACFLCSGLPTQEYWSWSVLLGTC